MCSFLVKHHHLQLSAVLTNASFLNLFLYTTLKYVPNLGFPMHEWALAKAVISTASQIAQKEGIKEVTEVKIKVGELQQIELHILEFALSQLKTPKFKNAKFNIETTRAELRCRICGNTWIFDREKLDKDTAEAIHFVPEIVHTYVKCSKCGSPDFEILKGRGIWLESIRGVKYHG